MFERTPLRNRLRGWFFRSFRKALATDDGRAAVADCLTGLLNEFPTALRGLDSEIQPYPELGAPTQKNTTFQRDDIIFLTGRFRAGTTLLWNIFRNLSDTTAYYEPFNERRWFDAANRGERVDSSHAKVVDYWSEYDGLSSLDAFYDEVWIRRNLYMDDQFSDPGMKKFIQLLVEHASGRPVLQFNRIDFRLPWIRRNFPRSKIIHIYRHPRDQWCSTLPDMTCFGPCDRDLAQYRQCDGFYLRAWARDLKYHFPFLEEKYVKHPYQLFYYLWKLSYLMAGKYADYSIRFERLVDCPIETLAEVFELLSIQIDDWPKLENLIVKTERGRWKGYADDAWFSEHEAECDYVISGFLKP